MEPRRRWRCRLRDDKQSCGGPRPAPSSVLLLWKSSTQGVTAAMRERSCLRGDREAAAADERELSAARGRLPPRTSLCRKPARRDALTYRASTGSAAGCARDSSHALADIRRPPRRISVLTATRSAMARGGTPTFPQSCSCRRSRSRREAQAPTVRPAPVPGARKPGLMLSMGNLANFGRGQLTGAGSLSPADEG
jgi:hypothetical protein